MSARAWRALALLPFVLGCGDRGSVAVADAQACPDTGPSPDAAPPPEAGAAPEAGADAAKAAAPTTIQVNFDKGLVADMGAAFQIADYASAPHQIDGMTVNSEPSYDQVVTSPALGVQQLLPAPEAAKGQSFQFGGMRGPTDPPLGIPGSGYHLARELFDLMKVPDSTSFGIISRYSPGRRLGCNVTDGKMPAETPGAACYLTGVHSVTIW